MPKPQVYVDETGIHIPQFVDWLNYYQESYKSIYGNDIYIDPDSQDGILLALFSQAQFDLGNAAVGVYNNFSPSTAQGAGLSSVVKTNGIRRRIPTYSTVVVTIVGQPGRLIANGVIGDNLNLGTRWVLPTFVIPANAEVDITAFSVVPGDINAAPHTLTNILTPQPGWQSVTNAVSAVAGAPVENDAELRRRQSRSAALPAASTLNGIYAAVFSLDGVKRVAAYQNDTSTVNADGIPANSIAVVVAGGNSLEIAQAIALKKPPGIPTSGDIVNEVIDARGVPNSIWYYSLREVDLNTVIWMKALPGFVSTTSDLIKSSVIQFINNQDISEDAYLSRIFSPANLSGEAALEATGFSQIQLDALSKTYHITGIAQGSLDMVIIEPRTGGAGDIPIVSTDNISVGQSLYIVLDDLSYYKVTAQNIIGNKVFILPTIPFGKSVLVGSQVYVVGDILIEFTEAAVGGTVDVILV